MSETATLLIGRSYSTCSACRTGAAPEESAHLTRLDYGDHDGRGCGARYVAVQPASYGIDDDVQAMRPDLPFLPAPGEDQ